MILNTNMRKMITQILHRKNVIDEPYLFIYDFLKFHPLFRLFLLSLHYSIIAVHYTSKLASKV